MSLVLDAHALMAFLEKEPGCEKIIEMFLEAIEKAEPLLMTTINYGEVIYVVLRECGEQKTRDIEELIGNLPVSIVDVDFKITREAARFKAFHALSYADCFAAALAKARGAHLVTGNKEFMALEKDISILRL